MTRPPQLWIDMDGVLADFDGGYLNHFGELPTKDIDPAIPDWDHSKQGTEKWRKLQEAPEFYFNLRPLPDAHVLVAATRALRPIILTGCPRGGWAEQQKIAWGHLHFPGIPMVLCRSHQKPMFCHQGDVLVDDWPKYKDKWEERGGTFIVHTSAKESLARLATLL